MADRKTTTYKKTSDNEISGLINVFKKLSPAKRQYSELSKSNSTSSTSSRSSFASNPYVTIAQVYGPPPCSSSSRNSSKQKDESRQKKKNEAKEKELLQKLQKSVNDSAKTLNEYVAVRNRKM